MLELNKEYFGNSILEIAKMVELNRDYFSELDSAIGDGDHGINMSIGFREVVKQYDTLMNESEDISAFLKKVGMILLSKVGGASGPLYGSFFMKMGDEVKGKNTVTFAEFAQMINLGTVAIEYRGKAEVGDKTMICALRPATNFLLDNLDTDDNLKVFSQFVSEMQLGSDRTIPLIANKGRALRLGERAIGHRDPGSDSSTKMMEVFYNEMTK